MKIREPANFYPTPLVFDMVSRVSSLFSDNSNKENLGKNLVTYQPNNDIFLCQKQFLYVQSVMAKSI